MERFEAAVSPEGAVRLVPAAEGAELGPALIRAAERGPGFLLLHLGLVHRHDRLPAGLTFARDLGAAYVARLCAEPDLERRRKRPGIPRDAAVLGKLAAAVPPMVGAEYVGAQVLDAWWAAIEGAVIDELGRFTGTVEAWLGLYGPAWNLVGRVFFHLAEHKIDPERPFAFLATYVRGDRKAQHAPLSAALAAAQVKGDNAQLVSLLVPVERAGQSSPLVADLLITGDLYHPLAWTPAEAHEFLQEIPQIEAAGVVVRVPDWWRARRPPRPEVSLTVGTKAPGSGLLGQDSLVDFKVGVTLDGETLTPEEIRDLLASQEGLRLVRGRWVQLDKDRLQAVLSHWKQVEQEASDGLSFLEGMRLLAGTPLGGDPADLGTMAATRVVAGPWLDETLAQLRAEGHAAADPGAALKAELRPYQKAGVAWLAFATRLGLGVCLADDMGLGKTIQVLSLFLLEKKRRKACGPHLLVVPASLLGNWQAEAARFAPSLTVAVAHPSAGKLVEPGAGVDVVLTTYSMLGRLDWLGRRELDLVVLDEAQAIKNPGARQSRAVKTLGGRARIALTGTPIENKLGDLWSLFDFLNPGLLGGAKEFTGFVKRLGEANASYAPLRKLVRPYLLRRLKSDRSVIADLPDKVEVKAYCGLTRPQAALYQRAVDELATELALKSGMQRRGLILGFLTRFKQICNHPQHWLKAGPWKASDSSKLVRLAELIEDIKSRQEKVLVFSQFREAIEPLAGFLAEAFGKPGLVLHGGTAIKQRSQLVQQFQEGDAPFFVLSLKAGGTGLNLTAASHVVHFDRWWNPAVEQQATDRAYRIGQHKNVLVHKMICRGTVEERVDALIEAKQGLARNVVGDGGELPLTELSDKELLAMVALDLRAAEAA
jgi:non-specific serine/threonine protein kinase